MLYAIPRGRWRKQQTQVTSITSSERAKSIDFLLSLSSRTIHTCTFDQELHLTMAQRIWSLRRKHGEQIRVFLCSTDESIFHLACKSTLRWAICLQFQRTWQRLSAIDDERSTVLSNWQRNIHICAGKRVNWLVSFKRVTRFTSERAFAWYRCPWKVAWETAPLARENLGHPCLALRCLFSLYSC